LLAKANRIFCGGTPASHFATVVCGRCGQDGQVEICNAGHCLPLHVRAGTVVAIPSTGLPLGLFAEADYEIRELTLEKGDGLVLHSDGLTEAFDAAGQQYGARRLTALLERNAVGEPAELLAAILDDLKRFRGGAPRSDDLTVMVLRRND
jgi:sigma-B regulation protein RsbU (phosphoserine phosphatase)